MAQLSLYRKESEEKKPGRVRRPVGGPMCGTDGMASARLRVPANGTKIPSLHLLTTDSEWREMEAIVKRIFPPRSLSHVPSSHNIIRGGGGLGGFARLTSTEKPETLGLQKKGHSFYNIRYNGKNSSGSFYQKPTNRSPQFV